MYQYDRPAEGPPSSAATGSHTRRHRRDRHADCHHKHGHRDGLHHTGHPPVHQGGVVVDQDRIREVRR